MSLRTPLRSRDSHGSVPSQSPSRLSKSYNTGAGGPQTPAANSVATDFASPPTAGNPIEPSPLAQSLPNHALAARGGKFEENFDAPSRQASRASYMPGDDGALLQRSTSRASTLQPASVTAPSRGGTLKKQASLRRKSSLKRSGSSKSLRAGSIKGIRADGTDKERFNDVFHTPVPTKGAPTEMLANRFAAWRKFLKDLITYFREVQISYEQRSKSLAKVSNVINNTSAPSIFLSEGGINDANRILRDYHRQAISDANKARDIEEEIVIKLTNLRNDLAQKIKEIKSLAGDFKNSVDKEKEATRRAVGALEASLAFVDSDPASGIGKADPYVIRLGVERQIERQIDEENYLHRAYLNLEGSGRELESIIVGEIQKSFNALASLLKRDADGSYGAIEKLRSGPIAIPRDLEWNAFVEHDPNFVNPSVPLRSLEDIQYTGKDDPAAAEVRAGMLERKSKYLKSYTPGWYVLSPTHLHEFKSADHIQSQPPVMSLYLPDQKLGSHSQPGSSSHKFMFKGRQTGSMHRGHSWIFRAESYDTMLAWYEAIKSLTEKVGEEKYDFVRKHARSLSTGSRKPASLSSELDEDEADEVPYSGGASAVRQDPQGQPVPQRPSPGGRFPSDLQVNSNLQAPHSPSSGSSDGHGMNRRAARQTPNPPISTGDGYFSDDRAHQPAYARASSQSTSNAFDSSHARPIVPNTNTFISPGAVNPSETANTPHEQLPPHFKGIAHEEDHIGTPTSGKWIGPTSAVVGGVVGAGSHRENQKSKAPEEPEQVPLHTKPVISGPVGLHAAAINDPLEVNPRIHGDATRPTYDLTDITGLRRVSRDAPLQSTEVQPRVPPVDYTAENPNLYYVNNNADKTLPNGGPASLVARTGNAPPTDAQVTTPPIDDLIIRSPPNVSQITTPSAIADFTSPASPDAVIVEATVVNATVATVV